ncbi:MAG: dipeptidase, partial [Scardovia wiggsiae]
MTESACVHTPFGSEVTWEAVDAGQGWAMDAGSAACTYAQQALADAFEAEPVNQGQGGSIPFIPEFLRLFPECQVLVT